VVVVSAFDPVRREIARRSLEKLIQDGRIHPTRIEEVVAGVEKDVSKQIFDAGKQAMMEANVRGLHNKLITLLGRLHFRTSYGQNVLKHSIEAAYLSQVIAEQLGLNGQLARRCGLLHDIGKAVDHEVEGGHPKIGADLCERYGEKEEVVNAVSGHHGDVEASSLYTPIIAAADAVSASRPGARRETLERYVQRLQKLEEIATTFEGVKTAYAIQAGREVRVIVDAEQVDDKLSLKVARDIGRDGVPRRSEGYRRARGSPHRVRPVNITRCLRKGMAAGPPPGITRRRNLAAPEAKFFAPRISKAGYAGESNPDFPSQSAEADCIADARITNSLPVYFGTSPRKL